MLFRDFQTINQFDSYFDNLKVFTLTSTDHFHQDIYYLHIYIYYIYIYLYYVNKMKLISRKAKNVKHCSDKEACKYQKLKKLTCH